MPAPRREVGLALLAALCVFNVVLVNALQDGLFLQLHTAAEIPLAMLCGSLLTAGVTLGLRRLMLRFSGPAALRAILVGLGAISAAMAAWNQQPTRTSTFSLFIAAELTTTLGAAAIWSYIQAPLDSNGLRTVLPRLGAYAGLGGLVAGATVPLVLRRGAVVPQSLLPVAAFAWMLAALLVRSDHVAQTKAGRARVGLNGAPWRLPLVRWLVLSTAGASWLALLIQFQNRVALQHALPPAQITSFMAQLLAVSSVLGVGVQALLTGRVLERWGVGVALGILPALALFLMGAYWWVPVLPIIAGALFGDKTLRPSLVRPAESCLQGALPPQERAAVTLLIAGVVAPVLKAVGSLALVLTAHVDRSWLLGAAIGIAFGLTLLSGRWGAIYARALERTLAEGSIGDRTNDDEPIAPLIDGPRLSILLRAIDSGGHHSRELALELLLPHGSGLVERAMRARLDSSDEAVRILALRWLAAQSPGSADASLRARFTSRETTDAERIALLAANPALVADDWATWLEASHTELRAQVIRTLARQAVRRDDVIAAVTRMLTAEHGPERIVGLQLARELLLVELANAVRALCQDRNTAVKREALETLAAVDPPASIPTLIASLDQPRFASSAARALATLGEAAVAECLARLRAASHGSSLRVQLLRALGRFRSSLAVPALLDDLRSLDAAERGEAIKSLRLVARETSIDTRRLQAFADDELARGLALLQARERLTAQLIRGSLLERELTAQIAATQERFSRALALLAPPGTMARIFWALKTPRSPHRDQARELLRTLLGAGPALAASLKLLEPENPWPPLGDLPIPTLRTLDDAIAWLSSQDDRWLRFALHHDLGRPLRPQEEPMQASLDTILFLKDVTLFATLTNAQLAEVARLAEKFELPSDARLFAAGDTVDYFYIVRSGSMRVVKEGVEMARLGAGECVGEMAVLAGTDRSATVEAVEPSQLLRFDAEDFLALLETYPEIGRGLLRALVRRLANARPGSVTVERPAVRP